MVVVISVFRSLRFNRGLVRLDLAEYVVDYYYYFFIFVYPKKNK